MKPSAKLDVWLSKSIVYARPRIQRTMKRDTFQDCLQHQHSFSSTPLRLVQPADNGNFTSIVDNPPVLVRSGRKHGPGLLILGIMVASEGNVVADLKIAMIPLTAFALGTWQINRLEWKTKLIAKFEDRLVRDPLPLPPRIDPAAIKDFDYRRIYAEGTFRHDQEMLIGPRMHDGRDGYLVITPLERDGEGTAILVNRGWIPKHMRNQTDRPDGLPRGVTTVEGLLREPWKKNFFTPDNKPQEHQFFFPDVAQMAQLTGSQAVWVEETMGMFCLHLT